MDMQVYDIMSSAQSGRCYAFPSISKETEKEASMLYRVLGTDGYPMSSEAPESLDFLIKKGYAAIPRKDIKVTFERTYIEDDVESPADHRGTAKSLIRLSDGTRLIVTARYISIHEKPTLGLDEVSKEDFLAELLRYERLCRRSAYQALYRSVRWEDLRHYNPKA